MTTTDDLTLDELRERLAEAQHDFEMAKFIDSYPRMRRERLHFAEQIRHLQALIREKESHD